MRCCSLILGLATITLCAMLPASAWAPGRRGGGGMARVRPQNSQRPGKFGDKSGRTPIQEFERLSPEQQQKALNRLPPEQRQRLQERLQRFNQLPPERQRALTNLYNRLHQLPPERQDAVRNSINNFSKQTPERQQAIREELRSEAGMSPEQRQAQFSSPEFRKRFSRKEQEIVRDMSEVLPPQ